MTRQAANAEDAELLSALESAALRRGELRGALESEGLLEPPSSQFAEVLLCAEAELRARIETASAELRARLAELRRARGATHGYRPLVGTHPAFLSRSV